VAPAARQLQCPQGAPASSRTAHSCRHSPGCCTRMTLSGSFEGDALLLNAPDCTFPSSFWKAGWVSVSVEVRAGSCSVGGSNRSTASTRCLIFSLGPMQLHIHMCNAPSLLVSQAVRQLVGLCNVMRSVAPSSPVKRVTPASQNTTSSLNLPGTGLLLTFCC
jgi:hypothetical protein